MRTIIFAGIFALSASSAIAQTGTPRAPSPPAAETAAAGQPGSGRPANLCQELLAFMKAPPPEAPAASAPAKPAAEAKSAPASGQAVQPKAPDKSGSAQEISGQSGPAHGAPDPNPKQSAQGNVQNAPQTSSLSAPVPTEPTAPSKESIMAVTEAQALAEANDIAACQGAARKLRLAGVTMPPPLLALTALDLRYQTGAQHPGAGTPQ